MLPQESGSKVEHSAGMEEEDCHEAMQKVFQYETSSDDDSIRVVPPRPAPVPYKVEVKPQPCLAPIEVDTSSAQTARIVAAIQGNATKARAASSNHSVTSTSSESEVDLLIVDAITGTRRIVKDTKSTRTSAAAAIVHDDHATSSSSTKGDELNARVPSTVGGLNQSVAGRPQAATSLEFGKATPLGKDGDARGMQKILNIQSTTPLASTKGQSYASTTGGVRQSNGGVGFSKSQSNTSAPGEKSQSNGSIVEGQSSGSAVSAHRQSSTNMVGGLRQGYGSVAGGQSHSNGSMASAQSQCNISVASAEKQSNGRAAGAHSGTNTTKDNRRDAKKPNNLITTYAERQNNATIVVQKRSELFRADAATRQSEINKTDVHEESNNPLATKKQSILQSVNTSHSHGANKASEGQKQSTTTTTAQNQSYSASTDAPKQSNASTLPIACYPLKTDAGPGNSSLAKGDIVERRAAGKCVKESESHKAERAPTESSSKMVDGQMQDNAAMFSDDTELRSREAASAAAQNHNDFQGKRGEKPSSVLTFAATESSCANIHAGCWTGRSLVGEAADRQGNRSKADGQEPINAIAVLQKQCESFQAAEVEPGTRIVPTDAEIQSIEIFAHSRKPSQIAKTAVQSSTELSNTDAPQQLSCTISDNDKEQRKQAISSIKLGDHSTGEAKRRQAYENTADAHKDGIVACLDVRDELRQFSNSKLDTISLKGDNNMWTGVKNPEVSAKVESEAVKSKLDSEKPKEFQWPTQGPDIVAATQKFSEDFSRNTMATPHAEKPHALASSLPDTERLEQIQTTHQAILDSHLRVVNGLQSTSMLQTRSQTQSELTNVEQQRYTDKLTIATLQDHIRRQELAFESAVQGAVTEYRIQARRRLKSRGTQCARAPKKRTCAVQTASQDGAQADKNRPDEMDFSLLSIDGHSDVTSTASSSDYSIGFYGGSKLEEDQIAARQFVRQIQATDATLQGLCERKHVPMLAERGTQTKDTLSKLIRDLKKTEEYKTAKKEAKFQTKLARMNMKDQSRETKADRRANKKARKAKHRAKKRLRKKAMKAAIKQKLLDRRAKKKARKERAAYERKLKKEKSIFWKPSLIFKRRKTFRISFKSPWPKKNESAEPIALQHAAASLPMFINSYENMKYELARLHNLLQVTDVAHQQAVADLQLEHQGAQVRIAQLNEQLAAVKHQAADRQIKDGELLKQYRRSEKECKQEVKRLLEMQKLQAARVAAAEEQFQVLQEQYANEVSERSSYQCSIKEYDEQCRKLARQKASLKERLRELAAMVNEAQRTKLAVLQERNELLQKKSRMEIELNSLQARLDKAEKIPVDNNHFKENFQKLALQLEEVLTEKHRYQQEACDAKNEVKSMQHMMESIYCETKRNNSEELEQELLQSQYQIETLQRMLQEASKSAASRATQHTEIHTPFSEKKSVSTATDVVTIPLIVSIPNIQNNSVTELQTAQTKLVIMQKRYLDLEQALKKSESVQQLKRRLKSMMNRSQDTIGDHDFNEMAEQHCLSDVLAQLDALCDYQLAVTKQIESTQTDMSKLIDYAQEVARQTKINGAVQTPNHEVGAAGQRIRTEEKHAHREESLRTPSIDSTRRKQSRKDRRSESKSNARANSSAGGRKMAGAKGCLEDKSMEGRARIRPSSYAGERPSRTRHKNRPSSTGSQMRLGVQRFRRSPRNSDNANYTSPHKPKVAWGAQQSQVSPGKSHAVKAGSKEHNKTQLVMLELLGKIQQNDQMQDGRLRELETIISNLRSQISGHDQERELSAIMQQGILQQINQIQLGLGSIRDERKTGAIIEKTFRKSHKNGAMGWYSGEYHRHMRDTETCLENNQNREAQGFCKACLGRTDESPIKKRNSQTERPTFHSNGTQTSNTRLEVLAGDQRAPQDINSGLNADQQAPTIAKIEGDEVKELVQNNEVLVFLKEEAAKYATKILTTNCADAGQDDSTKLTIPVSHEEDETSGNFAADHEAKRIVTEVGNELAHAPRAYAVEKLTDRIPESQERIEEGDGEGITSESEDSSGNDRADSGGMDISKNCSKTHSSQVVIEIEQQATAHSKPTTTATTEPTLIKPNATVVSKNSEKSPSSVSGHTLSKQEETTLAKPSAPIMSKTSKHIPNNQCETTPNRPDEPTPNMQGETTSTKDCEATMGMHGGLSSNDQGCQIDPSPSEQIAPTIEVQNNHSTSPSNLHSVSGVTSPSTATSQTNNRPSKRPIWMNWADSETMQEQGVDKQPPGRDIPFRAPCATSKRQLNTVPSSSTHEEVQCVHKASGCETSAEGSLDIGLSCDSQSRTSRQAMKPERFGNNPRANSKGAAFAQQEKGVFDELDQKILTSVKGYPSASTLDPTFAAKIKTSTYGSQYPTRSQINDNFKRSSHNYTLNELDEEIFSSVQRYHPSSEGQSSTRRPTLIHGAQSKQTKASTNGIRIGCLNELEEEIFSSVKEYPLTSAAHSNSTRTGTKAFVNNTIPSATALMEPSTEANTPSTSRPSSLARDFNAMAEESATSTQHAKNHATAVNTARTAPASTWQQTLQHRVEEDEKFGRDKPRSVTSASIPQTFKSTSHSQTEIWRFSGETETAHNTSIGELTRPFEPSISNTAARSLTTSPPSFGRRSQGSAACYKASPSSDSGTWKQESPQKRTVWDDRIEGFEIQPQVNNEVLKRALADPGPDAFDQCMAEVFYKTKASSKLYKI